MSSALRAVSRWRALALWACAGAYAAVADAAVIQLKNPLLEVSVQTPEGTFAVRDRRTGKLWEQHPISGAVSFPVSGANFAGQLRVELRGFYGPERTPLVVTLALDEQRPGFTVSLAAEGNLPRPLAYPHPFLGGQDLIVPLNEGIRYPVGDASIKPTKLITYGGHGGLSMPFWGVTDGAAAQMAIFETRDDAALVIDRTSAGLYAAPAWDAQKGRFGYERRLRYVFFDHGGYVALCKRYRAAAQAAGLFLTLAQKRRSKPAIDRLVGAVNVWCYEPDAPAMVREMQQAGIDRILWSEAKPKEVAALNALGVLTSKYDLYSDVMNPAIFPQLQGKIQGNWITSAWPDQIIRSQDQEWTHGWTVKLKSGEMSACGILCDLFQPDYARRRIAADLRSTPYLARFIDTATSMKWQEDYSPAHPMTRSDCARQRVELLRVVSEENHLVTGSENGLDDAVPYADYFEGMLSLVPYRVPDSGHGAGAIWTKPTPENLTKFQVGAFYRLPLWELVFHDCVVANWYWGDFSNKIAEVWDRRDLFNILYGTPPMFRFDRKLWEAEKDRFVRSYRRVAPVVRGVGYSEMVEHRWLTPDAAVQQTRFGNGTVITVNFGAAPFQLSPTRAVAGGGYAVGL